MEKLFRFLSIDSSTKSTGIAIWDNGFLSKSATINASKLKNINERFPYMAREILHMLQNSIPDAVYIEEAVVPRNVQTQRFLVRLQGVVYGWCLQHNCQFITIRPTAWRKLLEFKQGRNVKRTDLKEQARAYVRTRYRDRLEISEDECEAICIGEAALKLLQDKKENSL